MCGGRSLVVLRSGVEHEHDASSARSQLDGTPADENDEEADEHRQRQEERLERQPGVVRLQ